MNYETLPVLKLGDIVPEVEALQEKLKKLNLFFGTVNKTFDKATEIAVKQLQSDKNLQITGTTNNKTWEALYSLIGENDVIQTDAKAEAFEQFENESAKSVSVEAKAPAVPVSEITTEAAVPVSSSVSIPVSEPQAKEASIEPIAMTSALIEESAPVLNPLPVAESTISESVSVSAPMEASIPTANFAQATTNNTSQEANLVSATPMEASVPTASLPGRQQEYFPTVKTFVSDSPASQASRIDAAPVARPLQHNPSESSVPTAHRKSPPAMEMKAPSPRYMPPHHQKISQNMNCCIRAPHGEMNCCPVPTDKSYKKACPDGIPYKVKCGETIWEIADNCCVPPEVIMQYNKLRSPYLYEGDIIYIPSMQKHEHNFPKIYIVRAGDSLWSIAKKFNTTVERLYKKNNLQYDVLQIGKKLEIC